MYARSAFLVSLVLISYSANVQSQLCRWNIDCDIGRVCCLNRTCSRTASCPCLLDKDCKFGERCSRSRHVCYKKNRPVWPTYRPYSWKTLQYFTLKPILSSLPFLYCTVDSDCFGTEICEDGKCQNRRYSSSKGGFSWSGSKIVGIVLFVILASIISCLYHACTRARKPPNLPLQNVNVNAGSVAAGRIDHEMQAGNVNTTSTTVVELQDDTPLPPGAPPPYSSLEFEIRQGSDNLPEQPPPSYDEAVRN